MGTRQAHRRTQLGVAEASREVCRRLGCTARCVPAPRRTPRNSLVTMSTASATRSPNRSRISWSRDGELLDRGMVHRRPAAAVLSGLNPAAAGVPVDRGHRAAGQLGSFRPRDPLLLGHAADGKPATLPPGVSATRSARGTGPHLPTRPATRRRGTRPRRLASGRVVRLEPDRGRLGGDCPVAPRSRPGQLPPQLPCQPDPALWLTGVLHGPSDR
jgi:hypothetical protein